MTKNKSFTTRYNYVPNQGITNAQDSKTYQECKDDCDINIMYHRYLSKGFDPPNIAKLEQRYSDISSAKSYEEMLNIQQDVRNIFEGLPSDIRENCGHNVDIFMKIISEATDDKDVQEFQSEIFDKLGMLDRKEKYAEHLDALHGKKLPDIDPIYTQGQALDEKVDEQK